MHPSFSKSSKISFENNLILATLNVPILESLRSLISTSMFPSMSLLNFLKWSASVCLISIPQQYPFFVLLTYPSAYKNPSQYAFLSLSIILKKE